jgi:hypothetical protein
MNTVVYYPGFYPSADWLRLACLSCRVYVMHVKQTPKPPQELRQLDEALGGVLAVTRPWESATTAPRGDRRARPRPVPGVHARDCRAPQLMEGEARPEEVAVADATVAEFRAWLDHRAARLREQLVPSEDRGRDAADTPGTR